MQAIIVFTEEFRDARIDVDHWADFEKEVDQIPYVDVVSFDHIAMINIFPDTYTSEVAVRRIEQARLRLMILLKRYKKEKGRK